MSLSSPRLFLASRDQDVLGAASLMADAFDFNLLLPLPLTASLIGYQDDPRAEGFAHARENERRLRGSHILVVDLGGQIRATAYWLGLARGLGRPCFGFAPTWQDRDGQPFGMTEEITIEGAFEENETTLFYTDEPEEGLRLAFGEARRWVDAQSTPG